MLNYDDPDYFNKWLARDSVKKYIGRCGECQNFVLKLSTPEAWDQFDHISSFISTKCHLLSFCSVHIVNMPSAKNHHIDHNKICQLLILVLLLSKNVKKMRIHMSFYMHREVFFHILTLINPQSLCTLVFANESIELSDDVFNQIKQYIDKCTQLKLFYIKTGKIHNDNNVKLYQLLNSKETIEEIFTDDRSLDDEGTSDIIYNMILNNERIKILKMIKRKSFFDFNPYDQRKELSLKHEEHFLSWIIRFIQEKTSLYHLEINGHFYNLICKETNRSTNPEFYLLETIFKLLQNKNNIKTLSLLAYDIYDHNQHVFATLCLQMLQKNSRLEHIEFREQSYDRYGSNEFYRGLSNRLKPYFDRNKHNNIRRERTLFETMLNDIDLSSCNTKKQRIN